jgi:hypothetical protein
LFTIGRTIAVQEKVEKEAGEVTAQAGIVSVDGPDAVDVKLSVEAAEEMSIRLKAAALEAARQRDFLPKAS